MKMKTMKEGGCQKIKFEKNKGTHVFGHILFEREN